MLWYNILYLSIPWLFVFVCLWRHADCNNSYVAPCVYSAAFVVVVIMMIATDGSGVSTLGADILQTAWKTTNHVVKYLFPFVVYPIAVFWMKVASRHHSNNQETDKINLNLKSLHITIERKQAQIITWTIKVLVLIFVFFAMLDHLGYETDSILQITTVFSLGLSWSMRDWLSSMWGCFMLAFCTELTNGVVIKCRSCGDKMLKVKQTGIMFTVCEMKDVLNGTSEDVHLPNATLVSSGFSIIHMQN